MCIYGDDGAPGNSGAGGCIWAVGGGNAVQESKSRVEVGIARFGWSISYFTRDAVKKMVE
jgi:hypothetical protein